MLATLPEAAAASDELFVELAIPAFEGVPFFF